MKMFFMGAGIEGIASGERPLEGKELTEWKALDKMLMAYIYNKVQESYQYLVEDLESGREAWIKLKEHFEASTMGNRMAARAAFYDITHDTSRPISFYIQSLTTAAAKMKALGCTMDDIKFKDVLLMCLDSSFEAIRMNALSLKPEPSLDDIKGMLSRSTAAMATIKIEEQDYALAARGRQQRSGNTGGPVGGNLTDDQGYHWCDPNSIGCHRCGRSGHRAYRCMYSMPKQVKDWLIVNRSSSHSPPRPPSPPHHAAQAGVHSNHYAEQSHFAHYHSYSHSSSSNPELGPLLI